MARRDLGDVSSTTSAPEPSTSISATHSGTTKLAPPIAKPTMLLPAIIPHTELVIACHRAPKMKSRSATKITLFLPYLSAIHPASGLATRANRLVHDVIRLLSSVPSGRCERSIRIETRVEEMTPVLQVVSGVSYRTVTTRSISLRLRRTAGQRTNNKHTHSQTTARLSQRRRSKPRRTILQKSSQSWEHSLPPALLRPVAGDDRGRASRLAG